MREAKAKIAVRTNRVPSGFSLIELMVTVTILAIIAALALPAVGTGLRQQALTEATNEIMHLVDFARIQAMSRNKAYELKVTVAGGKNGSITVNESSNTRCDGFANGIPDIRSLNLDSGEFEDVRIVSTSPNGFGTTFQLCFKPSGRVVRTDTSKPLPPTVSGYGAGEGHIVVQLLDSKKRTIGPKNSIVIPYNGIPQFGSGG